MKAEDTGRFNKKIKLMFLVIDNNHVPSNDLVQSYWLGLKEFPLEKVVAAIDALMITSTDHITPAHIRQKIDNKPKMSDSEKRTAAAEELSKPHWERAGFESEEAYEKWNHTKWLESQDETV